MTLPNEGARCPRVVVADDHWDTADSLAELLTAHGFQVLAVGGGEAAVRGAADADALVVDLAMPQVDGFEVARRVRAGCNPLPFLVAITAYEWPRSNEFDLVLSKPLNTSVLVAALHTRARSR